MGGGFGESAGGLPDGGCMNVSCVRIQGYWMSVCFFILGYLIA